MSKFKVFLSPEDRDTNAYASSALYNGRKTNEREQMRRCADLLETALLRCGSFEVKNVQGPNPSMQERVRQSNAWPADLHVALHTNGFDGKVTGTRVHCYPSTKSRKIGKLIQDKIAPLSPGKGDVLKEDTSLYELRMPVAPAVLPEFGFHDNPTEAQWLIDNMETIAELTCQAICEYFGVPYVKKAAPSSPAEAHAEEQTFSVNVPYLEKGARGEAVKALQAVLNLRGANCGTVDGDFGTKTYEAVRMVQAKRGLPVTGAADEKTWGVLLGV